MVVIDCLGERPTNKPERKRRAPRLRREVPGYALFRLVR